MTMQVVAFVKSLSFLNQAAWFFLELLLNVCMCVCVCVCPRPLGY